MSTTKPKALELFAGAGGLALGLEYAGFDTVLLAEKDKQACATLRANRPHWFISEGCVSELDLTPYHNQVDLLTGGFPCQAFSTAGKRLGFEDVRGTLFFEFARAAKETNAKILVAENVRGLLTHDKGRTFQAIAGVIEEIGYKLVIPKVLNAAHYRVAQSRERIFLVATRKDLATKAKFEWPRPCGKIYTLRDALKKGELFDCDVPVSHGQQYSQSKAKVLAQVPAGGNWRDLPDSVQRQYMKKSYFSGGGRTGIARRMCWDEPCLTLTTSPAQLQTERCHPDEVRPFTVREYARIQSFPDSWVFEGTRDDQYRQIGNAVPVNLAWAMGNSLMELLARMEAN